ncbi:PREDICTED: uncharacterized protein LOC101811280 [Ficedula albicollis]|uniref:uncharacterized protein LOC101811280 n=1 Tax=Ficedula albicollis TaxID=59894 RepID=UPI0003594D25|nr:PREDICTED: uncharacterized protein LOC101811280 [Ficedula albicollis]
MVPAVTLCAGHGVTVSAREALMWGAPSAALPISRGCGHSAQGRQAARCHGLQSYGFGSAALSRHRLFVPWHSPVTPALPRYPETLPYLQPLPPIREQWHSQRGPMVHGSVPRVPQSHGDHASSSFTEPPTQDSLRSKAALQGLVTLPDKPRVAQLLGRGGHTLRGRNDQLPVMTRAQGPAAPRDQWPGTAPQHISRAPGLLPPLQPCWASTAPK